MTFQSSSSSQTFLHQHTDRIDKPRDSIALRKKRTLGLAKHQPADRINTLVVLYEAGLPALGGSKPGQVWKEAATAI